MKTKSFYLVLITITAIGSVISQNAEELTIPVETDNQFPPDHSESDGYSEDNGITIVDGLAVESTTVLTPVTNYEEVDELTLIKEDDPVTITSTKSPEFLCPEACICDIDEDTNDYIVDCSGYGLTKYPTPIDPRTTILKLNNNELTVIPKAISELKHLKDLDANDNFITELEFGSVSELPELINLNLANNRFLEYPKELEYRSSLNKLELLDLGDNDISMTFSADIFSNFKALQILTLPEDSPELAIDLCSAHKGTLVMVGTQSCKELSYESSTMNKDDSLEATLPGLIPFSPDNIENDTKNFNDVSAKLWNQDITNKSDTLSNAETKEMFNTSPVSELFETTETPEIKETTVSEISDPQPFPGIPGIKGILDISPVPVVPETPLNPETKKTSDTSPIPEALQTQSIPRTKETRDTSKMTHVTETPSYTDIKVPSDAAILPDELDTPFISGLKQILETPPITEPSETQASPKEIFDTSIASQAFEVSSTPMLKDTTETVPILQATKKPLNLDTMQISNISSNPELSETSPTQETTILDTTQLSKLKFPKTPDSEVASEFTLSPETKDTAKITSGAEAAEIPPSPGLNETDDISTVPETSEFNSSPEVKGTTEITPASEGPDILSRVAIKEASDTASVPEASKFTSSLGTSASQVPEIPSTPEINETLDTSLFPEASKSTAGPEIRVTSELSSESSVPETPISPEINETSIGITVPGEQGITSSADTTEIPKITIVPDSPGIILNLDTKETSKPVPVPKILEASYNPGTNEIKNVTPVPEAPLVRLDSEKEDTLITLPPSEIPEILSSATTKQISTTASTLKVSEVDITSKFETTEVVSNKASTDTSSILHITEMSEKPPESKISETPPVPNSNDLPVNDFSLRTAVNNAPEDKVALQSIIVDTPESSTNQSDVKVGATTVTKAGSGGVDKSVIAVIVAGMVVIVAIITIKKNWSSIKKRFSSQRPNDRSGRNANGTTPEEVPLQDKSPV